jgi:acetoin utilization protein AcuB
VTAIEPGFTPCKEIRQVIQKILSRTPLAQSTNINQLNYFDDFTPFTAFAHFGIQVAVCLFEKDLFIITIDSEQVSCQPISELWYQGGVNMLVKDWMSKTVVTVDEDDSMQEAMRLIKEHDIRMVPVMRKGKLVGILTDRDLKRASASDATTLEVHELLFLISKIKVKDIMSKNPITVPFDFTVEETAEVLLRNKISGVPVVDHDGDIVGTITQTDIFRVLISLTGVGTRGIQFAFQLEDRPGSIKEVADVIREYGGRMVSILSTYDRVPKGYRNVYIRMYGIDRQKIARLKEDMKNKATLLYMIDHRENKREIYS